MSLRTTCIEHPDRMAVQGKSRCKACETKYQRRRSARKNEVYATPRHRAAKRALYGLPCELRLPGCTGVADTVEHVIPVSVGGGRGPLKPACKHCNSTRGARDLDKIRKENEE